MYRGDFEDGTFIISSKATWLKWFESKGNHDSDGWDNAEDWFEDMLKCGLIVEV